MIAPATLLVWYFGLLIFAFGACVGSFLNVCVHRIPRDASIVRPRSHCPNCQHPIPWYDNIPLLSYLLLRARCRHCGLRISPRYFLIELLTALLFLAYWLQVGPDPRLPIYWLFASGLILGTFVDFEHMIIPDRVTLGGMIVGPLLSFLVPSLHHASTPVAGLLSSLAGLAVGFGLLWLVGFAGRMAFKKDAMGLGDVKLLGAIGAFLGWEAVLFTIMFSSLIGSIVGVTLIVTRGREWQSRIPFGPYLALAALVWTFWGEAWWLAYVRWISATPVG